MANGRSRRTQEGEVVAPRFISFSGNGGRCVANWGLVSGPATRTGEGARVRCRAPFHTFEFSLLARAYGLFFFLPDFSPQIWWLRVSVTARVLGPFGFFGPVLLFAVFPDSLLACRILSLIGGMPGRFYDTRDCFSSVYICEGWDSPGILRS